VQENHHHIDRLLRGRKKKEAPYVGCYFVIIFEIEFFLVFQFEEKEFNPEIKDRRNNIP